MLRRSLWRSLGECSQFDRSTQKSVYKSFGAALAIPRRVRGTNFLGGSSAKASATCRHVELLYMVPPSGPKIVISSLLEILVQVLFIRKRSYIYLSLSLSLSLSLTDTTQ